MARTQWIRIAVYVASALAILTLAMGFLHTRLGRPLLARLGGCPVQASPDQVERARLSSARATQGHEASPAQPALGFVLDRMTLSDAQSWAKRENVSCDDSRSGTVLTCSRVPGKALGNRSLGAVDELVLAFSPTTQRLVNITTSRAGLDGPAAEARLKSIAADLEAKLGKPTREAGEVSADYLASAPMRTALVRYRFTDYQADVAATNLPGRGLVVREHYMSARD